MFIDSLILLGLGLSLLTNAVLTYKLVKKPKKQEVYTVEAKDLLSNLLSGSSLVKIECLDPSAVFKRSPRDL